MSVGNTPAGPNVVVQPEDTTTGTTPVTLTFDNVTQAGTTSLTTSSSGPPPPSGFKLGTPATYFSITTTAQFSGFVEVCINYSGITFGNENNLKLFHFNASTGDVTSSLDTVNDIICGIVDSLSVFAVFQANQPPVADAGSDQVVECSSPTGAPVTLNGSGSSDPDGDSLTFTWTGPFPEGGGTVTGVSPTVTLALGGPHTITLTVDDGNGGSDSDTVVIIVQDTTAPDLTLSPDSLTVVVPTATATGATVDLSGIASAGDICDSVPVISDNAPAEFPIGLTSVTFTATDASGNFTEAQLTVHVVYNFIGFLPPIRNDGSSIFKSGRTAPIKFQLTAAEGSFVTNATATLAVFKITDAILGSVDVESPGESNADNFFRFDPATNQYIYNLSTKGYSAGTYLLRVSLNDQTAHEVQVSVR